MKVFIFAVDVLNLRLFDQMRWFGWNDELSWRKTAGLLCSFWTTAWTFCCGILTSLYLKTDRKMFRYEVYAFYFSLRSDPQRIRITQLQDLLLSWALSVSALHSR